MSGASLDGVRAKLAWAARHLELLNSEYKAWFEPPGNPSVGAETDPINQRYNVVYYEPRPRPVNWSLIAGDFLNNLRSVLDHLVCQVVISQGGAPGQNHAFPLAFTEEWWIENVADRRRRSPGPLDGIDPASASWRLIADSQPYIGRSKAEAEATDLAILARLNNTDKHRELHVATLAMGKEFEISLDTKYRLRGGYLPPTGTPIEPNAPFGWLMIDLIDADKADLKLTFPVEVAFDGVPITRLMDLFEEVRALVVAFEGVGL